VGGRTGGRCRDVCMMLVLRGKNGEVDLEM